MRLIAFLTLALTAAALPAYAQDRTPPVTDLRAYAPPIDWASNQQRPQGVEFYSLFTDRGQTTDRVIVGAPTRR